jgi:hypothetical protein
VLLELSNSTSSAQAGSTSGNQKDQEMIMISGEEGGETAGNVSGIHNEIMGKQKGAEKGIP